MQITILQWNVWYKEDVGRVLEVLNQHKADIICLQELTHGYIKGHDESTWQYIAGNLGYEYCCQEIPIFKKDTQWLQANAIFSRYPIKSSLKKWLHVPKQHSDPEDQYRGYLEARVAAGGKGLTVGTTHMSFRPDPDNDLEIEQLLPIIDANKERYILTGDINAVPQSRRIRELTKKLNHAGPPFEENTWTTKPFKFAEFEAKTLDWRYDYIFNTRDIKVLKAKIISTDASDHLPVFAAFELP